MIYIYSEIIPIYKKQDPQLISNYRHISILPNISKVYERCILSLLTNHEEKLSIIPDCQDGYRKNKSTKDAVLNLRLKLENNYSKNKKLA